MSLDQFHNLPEAAQQAILNGPALHPPPGTVPNLDNPPNQDRLGLAVTTLCLSVSTLAILLTAYAKFHRGKVPHYEDGRNTVSPQ
ncbi:hypothetical protein CIB48_g12184 [Xylaria polymorpha]|nr:hypothetical protein CIB48_g12184 [Xylaria polymorpha]